MLVGVHDYAVTFLWRINFSLNFPHVKPIITKYLGKVIKYQNLCTCTCTVTTVQKILTRPDYLGKQIENHR